MRAGPVLVVLVMSCGAADAADYGFAVNVTLSQKAEATLEARGEAIVVRAMYSGKPIPSKVSKADEDGMIDLGDEDAIIPGRNGQAVITGSKVIRSAIGWVKAVDVLVNVFTARRTTPDNLIDCGIFEDTLAKAQVTGPVAIACKMIGEP